MAHNSTQITGKESEVIKINKKKLNKIERIKTKANSAHNIYIEKDNLFYCDSLNGKFVKNNRSVFNTKKLTRGLSVTDSYFFLGGSEINRSRFKRINSNPSIYIICKENYELITEMCFKNIGNLYEIRQFNANDYSFAN
jgi:hypothetical protein